MPDDPLLGTAHDLASSFLKPPLSVRRAAPLLYSVTVNNALKVTVDPRRPVRGRSAFETDLCVFEEAGGVELPRVVIAFKARITTHAILTYSAKARKHKQIYPYLRYGIIMAGEGTIPGRVFVHNEALDFGLAGRSIDRERFSDILQRMIDREVRASRLLEEIAFKKPDVIAFNTELTVERA